MTSSWCSTSRDRRSFERRIFPIPFSKFGPYDEGSHSITADGEALTFHVSHGAGNDFQPSGAGSLAWSGGVLQDRTAPADVCGAITSSEDPADDVLVRRGAQENWLVERTGRMSRLRSRPCPAFCRTQALCTSKSVVTWECGCCRSAAMDGRYFVCALLSRPFNRSRPRIACVGPRLSNQFGLQIRSGGSTSRHGSGSVDADLLLTWMSETGSGDIRDLRDRVMWAARAADRNPKPHDSGKWLRDVSSLGHAEIDWERGRWAVAPAAGVLLPGTGGTAVLCGSRRMGAVERLSELNVSVHLERPPAPYEAPLPAPSSVFVQADSIAELRGAFAEIGIRYGGYGGDHIAAALRQIDLGAPAAPPARGEPVECLAPTTANLRFSPGLPSGDGLCRISVLGRPSYIYRSVGRWFHIDRAEGILYELAARGVSVLRWRHDRTSGHMEIGTVFVDLGAPLPPLQDRTLVLCSGLPLEFGKNAQTSIYRNVPREIASLVATSTRQRLVVIT